MPKNLVIVESPAKAGTIEGYLGKDFTVESSYGHVRDLPKGDNAIDKENGFKPKYEVSKDKKEVVKKLKKLAKDAETVYLASDDDREGEAIAWHLSEALKLDSTNTKRIVFREITKTAVLNALESPREIDMELVNAQQARRVLDRLVGFELSPILWRKIKTGLSAGRVQSVAVRLVVEREREIDGFNATSSFKITASFTLNSGEQLRAELPKKFGTADEAKAFLEKCHGADYAIANLESKPAKKSPAAPFTTSTLQQEASRKLGYSVSQTMSLAQKLYEKGMITYMRTDSTNLSGEAISGATKEITTAYGENFVKVRKYKTKSSTAQEAHEAIRPTNFANHSTGIDNQTTRLYELVWKRAIASQMADAELEKTTATISISTTDEHLISTGEVIKFEGFLKVYVEGTDEENGNGNGNGKGILPALTIGEKLNCAEILAREVFARHAARYTEASLVKKLEEMGIGRPSTYAPTISTIVKRNYVVKESRDGKTREYTLLTLTPNGIKTTIESEITGAEKKKLFPTDIGIIVNDFLVEHFPNIVDYSFTANVEEEFDKIANGKEDWTNMIDTFYHPFHTRVEKTAEDAERPQGRELGVDPATGKKVFARLGRFGPLVQIGEPSDDPEAEKPKYASLRRDQLLENISLEDALELFKLPRQVGTFEDEPITAAIGRFGPYVRHAGKFASLTKEDDPYTIDEERAIELILAKRKADAERFIKSFDENPDIQVLNGRYGPYIKAGKKNVKIPKGTDPKSLTLEQCLELAEKTPEKKGRGGKRKKK